MRAHEPRDARVAASCRFRVRRARHGDGGTRRAGGDCAALFVLHDARMDSQKAIDELLVACADDEHLLRHEKSRVDPRRAALLARLADERHAFVTALGALPAAHEHGDVSLRERLRERMLDFREMMTGGNTTDAISACRYSGARLADAYEAALQLPWPKEALELLETQRACVVAEQDELLHVQF